MRRPDRNGVWLILSAAVLWGTTGTAQALGPEVSSPLGVGLVRLLTAAPALALIAIGLRSIPRRAELRWAPIALAGAGMALYQPAFFTAVDRTGVAVGTAVAIGVAPVLTGLLSVIVDRDRPGRSWWLATMLAVGGVAILALAGADIGVDALGILAAIGAGLSYAVYVLASKRVVASAPPVGAMAVVFAVAAVTSLPLLAVVDLSWLTTPSGMTMALHLGLLATALAYVLFAVGLHSIEAPTAATLSLAEPVTATLLGLMVLGERLQPLAWLALGLIFGGLWIIVRTTTRTEPVPPLAY
jgi:drug/metabolite transporter, DME family